MKEGNTKDILAMERELGKYKLLGRRSPLEYAINSKGQVFITKIVIDGLIKGNSNFKAEKIFIRVPDFVSGLYAGFYMPAGNLIRKINENNPDEQKFGILTMIEKPSSILKELKIIGNDREMIGDIQNLFTSNNLQFGFKNRFGEQVIEMMIIENLKANKVRSLERFMAYKKNIEKVDISSFETHDLINLRDAFRKCESLKEVKFNSEVLRKINQGLPNMTLDEIFKDTPNVKITV